MLATLTFGVAATVYETMRARLEATTLALRTKERDEADARRLAAEARLSALEARVQPHFLFNTLNSICGLIHEDPAAADRWSDGCQRCCAPRSIRREHATRPTRPTS